MPTMIVFKARDLLLESGDDAEGLGVERPLERALGKPADVDRADGWWASAGSWRAGRQLSSKSAR